MMQDVGRNYLVLFVALMLGSTSVFAGQLQEYASAGANGGLLESADFQAGDSESFQALAFRDRFLNPHIGRVGSIPDRQIFIDGSSRSVPLAAGLSAILPGAGQAYNKQWIKAGGVFLAEVALVAGYATWRSQGLDGEDAFRATAHASWSPEKYALWLNDYSDFLIANHGASVTAPDIVIPSGIDFTNPGGWSAAATVQVTELFEQIRAVESQMFHPETGASFSHRLPFFAEQQYYELIGKYFQFAPGWSDYAEWTIDGVYTDAIDPERSDDNGEKLSVTDRFFDYADDHARSQTLLRRASRISALLFVNHILAAADAAIFAKLHNQRVATTLAMVPTGYGQASVGAYLKISF